MAFTLSSFYNSSEWKKFRKVIIAERIARDGEIVCEHCNKPILNSYEVIAHHCNTYLTEQNVNDFNISLNPENIQLVHHVCHNRMHEKFANPCKKVYIVFGSPGAGKSSYVNDIAKKNDLILDLDALYNAINNYRSPKLYSNVMQLWDALLDMVKTRNGKWENAYIILANCRGVERTQRMLDAEVIHIDTPKDVCYERATNKIKKYGEPYKKYIDDYWDEWQSTYKKLLTDKYEL